MTHDQQKERDALNEALKCNNARMRHNKVISSDQINIHLAAQSYADHYEEIQALKSGEWVLVPIEPTEEMADAAAIRPDANVKSDTNLIFYGGILKAMVAARPNVKENDDE